MFQKFLLSRLFIVAINVEVVNLIWLQVELPREKKVLSLTWKKARVEHNKPFFALIVFLKILVCFDASSCAKLGWIRPYAISRLINDVKQLLTWRVLG